MVEQHPAVAHLTAALDRAETMARAATRGPWVADGGAVYVADGHPATDPVVDWAYDDNPQHIAAWHPQAVLRMVAADRDLLAEHAPWDVSPWACRACITVRAGYPEEWEPDHYPCTTLLNRARAWGWDGAR